jgi:hypothetical protein
MLIQPPYVGQLKQLYSFCIILYIDRNPHSLAELPLAQSTSILSPPIWTTDWNFLVANDPTLYFKSPFIDRVMYLLSKLPPVCTLNCTFAHVIVAQFNFHTTTWFP